MSTNPGDTDTTCETAGRSDADSLKDAIASQQRRFEELLASQALESKKRLEAHKEIVKAAAKETAARTAELGFTLPENLVQPAFSWSAKGKDDAQSLREDLRSPHHKVVEHSNKDNPRSHDEKIRDLSGDNREKRSLHHCGNGRRSPDRYSHQRTRGSRSRSPDRRSHHRTWGNRSRSPDRRSHHRTWGNRSRSPDRRSHHRTWGNKSRSPDRRSHHRTRVNRSRSPDRRSHHRTRVNRSRSPDRRSHHRTRSQEREDRSKELCKSSPGSPGRKPHNYSDKCT